MRRVSWQRVWQPNFPIPKDKNVRDNVTPGAYILLGEGFSSTRTFKDTDRSFFTFRRISPKRSWVVNEKRSPNLKTWILSISLKDRKDRVSLFGSIIGVGPKFEI